MSLTVPEGVQFDATYGLYQHNNGYGGGGEAW